MYVLSMVVCHKFITYRGYKKLRGAHKILPLRQARNGKRTRWERERYLCDIESMLNLVQCTVFLERLLKATKAQQFHYGSEYVRDTDKKSWASLR